MHRSQTALALGVIGLSLTAAGCGSGGSSSTASVSAHSSAATPVVAVTPAAAAPVTTTAPASSPAPAGALAGVVADCTSAPPRGLSVRPASIALACADNGSGVQAMTWTSWSGSAAAGHGTFWDKLCTPSCADGKTGSYPVTVALSMVKTSPDGLWFSHLAVTWGGARP